MEITGKVIAVLAAQQGTSQRTGNTWMSQEFVIETPGQYPKKSCFRLFGADKIGNAASLLVPGTDVKVSFDIDAREYNGRWFNSLDAWKIEASAAQQGFQAAAPATVAQPAPVAPATAPSAVPPPAASAIPAPQPNQQGSELPF